MNEAKVGQAHTFFWFVSAILGVIATSAPGIILPASTRDTKLLMVTGSFFVIGIFLGALDSVGVWRWGIGTILLVPFVDYAGMPHSDKLTSVGAWVNNFLSYTANEAPEYAALALPALLGAYLGAYFSRPVGR